MSDVFTRRKRSEVMSRIRGTGNKDTELRLMQIFRANGITGWRRGCVIRGQTSHGKGRATDPGLAAASIGKTEDRRQTKRFSVRPDFVFQKLKTAVFVDGCFWHGCPRHATWPRTRAAFWLAKITGNKARDRHVNRLLRAKGWTVVRVWEHELRRRDEAKLVRRLTPNLCPRRP